MCFSAGASFGAAAILGAAGVVTINKVKSPSQIMFASIPLVFAIQQVAEGFEWLSFRHEAFENYRVPMMYLFLFFAQIVWPALVPISIWRMEPDKNHKKILGWLSVLGLTASALLSYRMLMNPVVSDVEGHHIRYAYDSPQWLVISSSILYVIATLVPAFVSSLKNTNALGLLMLTALIVTQIFYREYLVSVWCFFAALLSVNILFVIQNSLVSSHLHSILHDRIRHDKLRHE